MAIDPYSRRRPAREKQSITVDADLGAYLLAYSKRENITISQAYNDILALGVEVHSAIENGGGDETAP